MKIDFLFKMGGFSSQRTVRLPEGMFSSAVPEARSRVVFKKRRWWPFTHPNGYGIWAMGVNPNMVGFPNKPMGFSYWKWWALGVWNGGYHQLRKHPAHMPICLQNEPPYPCRLLHNEATFSWICLVAPCCFFKKPMGWWWNCSLP